MNRNVQTFIACDNEYGESKAVIFGAPYDSTTSYRPGARFASSAVRNESYGIESYSIYQDRDLEDIEVFDGGDIELPFGGPGEALNMIEKYELKVLDDGKIPVMIGGEHLVTLGALRAAASRYKDIHIIHFDAHADLRDEYLGMKYSHATVMRRCHDIVGDGKIYQFGIRSGDRQEIKWGMDHVVTCRYNFDSLDDTVCLLKDKNAPVYLTIDLDVLDPSVFPGTGTPEAGGVSYQQLTQAVSKVSQLNIVAADVVELSPPYDTSGASTALTCKFIRELLLYIVK